MSERIFTMNTHTEIVRDQHTIHYTQTKRMNERTNERTDETNRCEILSVPLNCNLFEDKPTTLWKRTRIYRILPRQQTQKSYAIIIEKWEQQPFRIHVGCFSLISFICATEKWLSNKFSHNFCYTHTICSVVHDSLSI